MTINHKVARIHPDLDEVRTMFNHQISEKLGVDAFPKSKSDVILAKAIKTDLLNFDIVKNKQKLGVFDIKWK